MALSVFTAWVAHTQQADPGVVPSPSLPFSEAAALLFLDGGTVPQAQPQTLLPFTNGVLLLFLFPSSHVEGEEAGESASWFGSASPSGASSPHPLATCVSSFQRHGEALSVLL